MMNKNILEKEQYSEEIHLRDLILKIEDWFQYLKSKWLFIVVMGLVGGIIGFSYAFYSKPTYIATLSFALEDDKGSSGGGLGGLASQFGFDLGGSAGGAFAGSNLMELMKSRSIVEKTLLSEITIDGKKNSLVEYYIDFNNLRKNWERNPVLYTIHFHPNQDRSTFTLQQDSILGEIYHSLEKESLSISQIDKKISITNIEVRSKNELFAKLLAEALAENVSNFYIETKSKKAKMNVNILERQTDSVRAELNMAISGVAYANDNTFNLNPALNIKRVVSSKKQIDVQANTAILTQLVANLELARVALRKETPLMQIIDRPILPLEKVKLSKLKTMITFGFIFGFITIVWFLLRRVWNNIMQTSM